MIKTFKHLDGFGYDGLTVDDDGYVYRMQTGPVTEVTVRAGEKDIAVNINQLIVGADGNDVPSEESQWNNYGMPTLTVEEFCATAIRVDAGDTLVITAGEVAIGERGIHCVAIVCPEGSSSVYGGVSKPI